VFYLIHLSELNREHEVKGTTLNESYTPSLKKLSTYLLLLVKYEQILIKKLEGLSRDKPSTKLFLKCPLQLKYVLALPWEICSVRLSRQRYN